MAPLLFLYLCIISVGVGYSCDQCLCHGAIIQCHRPCVKSFPDLTMQQKYDVHSVFVTNTNITDLPMFTLHEYPYLKELIVFNNPYLKCNFVNGDFETHTDCNVHNASLSLDYLTISRENSPSSECNDDAVIILGVLLAAIKVILALVIAKLQKYKKLCDAMVKAPGLHTNPCLFRPTTSPTSYGTNL